LARVAVPDQSLTHRETLQWFDHNGTIRMEQVSDWVDIRSARMYLDRPSGQWSHGLAELDQHAFSPFAAIAA
jgi:hypothetical protein